MNQMIGVASAILLLTAGAGTAADASPDIHVNQVGYLPSLPKMAVVSHVSGDDSSFSIVSEPGGEVVLRGAGKARTYWAAADDTARVLDFSSLTTPGTYRVSVPGKGVSWPFVIGKNALIPVLKGAIRSYYYQRASTALLPEHAGAYARAAGHLDTAVRVHNSAATADRKANSYIRSAKGWYDAGDYGKYIVNSGISVWTLLDAYQRSPDFFDTLSLNIPESGNNLPDLLDEVLWNVDWMLTMQDLDGGVYHKLTTPNFSGFVMPDADKAARYVVKKSTAAALDFAAVMAKTSRIFRRFESQRPGFADSCLAAAIRAWRWAQANPKVLYIQDSLKTPPINTGTYADGALSDEKQWAAVELTLATAKDSFWRAAYTTGRFIGAKSVQGWGFVSPLGLMSALADIRPLVGVVDTSNMRSTLALLAEEATIRMRDNPYKVAVSEDDFNWGSTAVTGNIALASLRWFALARDTASRDAAASALDWILGRNPLGTSFVTGFGSVTPMFPHHRPSGADGIAAPIPGFVVGGPNSSREDATACGTAAYPSELPALSWLDNECSYASNEVAINWNAPLIAILGYLQANENIGWVGTTPRTPTAPARIALTLRDGTIALKSMDGVPMREVQLLDLAGRTLAQATPASTVWTLRTDARGVLVVRVRTDRGWTSLRASKL